MFHLTKEEKLVLSFIATSILIGNLFMFVSKKSPYLKDASNFIENFHPSTPK